MTMTLSAPGLRPAAKQALLPPHRKFRVLLALDGGGLTTALVGMPFPSPIRAASRLAPSHPPLALADV